MPTIQAPRPRRSWRLLSVVALVVLLAAVAIPAFAANPGVAPGGGADAQPAQAEKSPNPGKGAKEKKAKVPKEAVTLRGTVSATTDEDGRRAYRLSSGGKTYDLDGGPSWFYGDEHPLEAYVGKTVSIAGEIAAGSSELGVLTVDGTALRASGKPPWAGGWKQVGKDHPGWSQEKADRLKARADKHAAKFGDCFPPGQCKPDETAD